MRTRAERAEQQLRIERELRESESSLFSEQRALWDADRRLLEDRCGDAERQAHLIQIKRAREDVINEMRWG